MKRHISVQMQSFHILRMCYSLSGSLAREAHTNFVFLRLYYIGMIDQIIDEYEW